MANITQRRDLFTTGFLALLFLLGSVLFLTAVTIVLSLIPVYLLESGSNINIDYDSISYQATYATNSENASQLMITDTSFLPNALKSQLHFPKSSNVIIRLSKFLPLSSATLSNRKKRESACDYDTSGMIGDRYITKIQIDNPNICHTSYCHEKWTSQVIAAVKHYRSLVLPFKLSNDSMITISMALCKFGSLFSVVPTCTDNIRNQDETDVDCGGAQCTRRCIINQTCSTTTDCNNATCIAGTCLDQYSTILAVCQMIKTKTSSSSQVLYPSDVGYSESIAHYILTSTMRSVCSVLPDTIDDVATILKIMGQYRVPFAIKGGGYTVNPGFSSTIGIHISMSRFRKIIYHAKNESIDIGSGLIWNDVYETLGPYNVTVVGGRISGVGVAGHVLGGGYSWKSNQYGLSIDTVYEYELVTPNGTVVYVNNNSYPDLFFGLKGGFNNFGIVTNFNMRVVSQTLVYAGSLSYIPSQFNALIEAFTNFQARSKDPKAQVEALIVGTSEQIIMNLLAFYDGPAAPNGTFDEFLAIPHSGNIQTQSFFSFFNATYIYALLNTRCRINSISITRTDAAFINGLLNQMAYLNSTLGSKAGALFIFAVEPYISTYLDKSQGGAYPHVASSTPLFPFIMAFSWQSPSDDDAFINGIKSTSNDILQLAINDGQDVGYSKQIIYANYAVDDTPLRLLYGDNVARLQTIRKALDPNNVMYLTGGFKL